MSEFLHPKSMITPGIAGGLMMLLVNGLAVPFPELPARYVALVLSFVFGALVVLKASTIQTVLERIVYWVVNSLVIFVVGFGANNLGRDATGASADRGAFVRLLPSAYADEPKKTPPATHGAGTDAASTPATQPSDDEAQRLKAEIEALRRENAELKNKKTTERAADRDKSGSFFKKW